VRPRMLTGMSRVDVVTFEVGLEDDLLARLR
jgi:hypothetical protein